MGEAQITAAPNAAPAPQRFSEIGPVQEHIARLMDAGWRFQDIEKVSGVSCPTISRIRRGAVKKITVESADAILGTTHAMRHRVNPGPFVEARGVRRRLQALAAVGWAHAELMRRIGRSPAQASWFLRTRTVTPENHRLISALYDDLWDKKPPTRTAMERRTYDRVRAHAKQMGWHSPLDWDDIDNDPEPPKVEVDDEPYIDDVKVERALRGENDHGLNYAERRTAVRIGHSRRWSDPLIAQRLRLAQETVQRIRAELHLAAWPNDELIDRSAAA